MTRGLSPQPPEHAEGGKAHALHFLMHTADVPGSPPSFSEGKCFALIDKIRPKIEWELLLTGDEGNEDIAGDVKKDCLGQQA